MKIKICTTDNFSSKEWNSYHNSFNTVFETNRDLEYFKHKYKKSIDCSFICTSKIIKYGFLKVNREKRIKSFTKNEKISHFSNKDNHLFYSGVCFINKELLKKNLHKIQKNFELNLFNTLIRKNKTKVFFDKGEFRDFNNLEDIYGLKK